MLRIFIAIDVHGAQCFPAEIKKSDVQKFLKAFKRCNNEGTVLEGLSTFRKTKAIGFPSRSTQ